MSKRMIFGILVVLEAGFLTGCAGLTFNDTPQSGALTYYETVPYLLVTFDKDCTPTASVIGIPGKARSVSFKNGYGSAALSVGLSGGMLTSVGQTTDSGIPATITSLASLATAVVAFKATRPSDHAPVSVCPSARLYSIGTDASNVPTFTLAPSPADLMTPPLQPPH